MGMTTSDDFLSAIKKAGPDGDPMLWLTFADWLEEDERLPGDALLAESIRIALELEGMKWKVLSLRGVIRERGNGDGILRIHAHRRTEELAYTGDECEFIVNEGACETRLFGRVVSSGRYLPDSPFSSLPYVDVRLIADPGVARSRHGKLIARRYQVRREYMQSFGYRDFDWLRWHRGLISEVILHAHYKQFSARHPISGPLASDTVTAYSPPPVSSWRQYLVDEGSLPVIREPGFLTRPS
jgi:hypothetical protein